LFANFTAEVVDNIAAPFQNNNLNNVCDLDQYRDILEVNRAVSKTNERVAVLETHYNHVNEKLNDIDKKIDVILESQSKTDNSFIHSKGFIGGITAASTIFISIFIWFGKLLVDFWLKK